MEKNQKGFGAVEVLLLLLLNVVVAFAGWYVWNNQKTTYSSSNASQSTNTTSTKTSTPAVTQKYVTIKEWGVRAPYNGKLNLLYKIREGGSTADFTSQELLTIDKTCDYKFGGIIGRFAPTDSVDPDGNPHPTAEELAKTDSSVRKVGNYYYVFYHTEAGCHEGTDDLLSQTNDAVKSVSGKLEAY